MRAARVLAAARNDARLQWRQGFYAAYLLVTLAYVLVLRQLPPGPARVLAPVIVFSDPAMIGFFFVGAALLLERQDRTLDALFVTPLRTAEYLLAKIGSLGVVVALTSLAIAWGGVGAGLHPVPLLLGVLLTAGLGILSGIALVVRFETLNRFALGGGLAVSVFALPLLDWAGIVESPLLRIFPTAASIALIGGSFAPEPPPPATLLLATAWLAAWNAAAWIWARRWLDRHVVGAAREGGRA